MEIVKVALRAIRANKLRSSLTTLGIIVGIFSIISISTVISMLQGSIESGLSQLGQNTFQIQKSPRVRTGGSHSEWAKIRRRPDITLENYRDLRERLVSATAVGAELWTRGRRIQYESERTNPNISLGGVTPDAFITNDWNVVNGRAINKRDIDSYRRVVVLGADIAKQLFKAIDPVGREVRVGGYKAEVIGVLEDEGELFGQSQGNHALMPITTWQGFFGKRNRSVNITVMAPNSESYEEMIQQAEGFMRTVRKVPPGEPNDFDIWSNESILEQINEITSGVRIGALVIAAIALLAAGVGIMNIMLVSVTERTREIGIRKAIGAKRNNILVQFLIEAIILTLIGGVIGIVLGVGVGNFAGSFLQAKAAIPVDWIAIGVFLCILIGLVFGTYPAYKASNLDPIEALRYE